MHRSKYFPTEALLHVRCAWGTSVPMVRKRRDRVLERRQHACQAATPGEAFIERKAFFRQSRAALRRQSAGNRPAVRVRTHTTAPWMTKSAQNGGTAPF